MNTYRLAACDLYGLFAMSVEQSSDKRLAKLKQTIQDAAVGTGDSARLNITNIHDRVPRQVVVVSSLDPSLTLAIIT